MKIVELMRRRLRLALAWVKWLVAGLRRQQRPALGPAKASLCQVCGERISLAAGKGKYRHFQERHPEYKFSFTMRVTPGLYHVPFREYKCMTCGEVIHGFDDLVARHRHQGLQQAGVPSGSR